MTVYGTNNCAVTELDTSMIFRLGFDEFAKMLRTKKMPLSFDKLVKPVYMLNAIQKSVAEGVEVQVEGVE